MATMARAHITAGSRSFVLPVNVYTAKWGYKENTVSRDTLGGRVVQLLSVQVTGLSIESVAGSRNELQKMAEAAREIMQYHVTTLRPATFVVPSRKWNFRVYLTDMPQMGWDLASTTYPYQLQFQIDEDLSGIKTAQVESGALTRLYDGIGYNPSLHGGDPKGFEKTVKTVLSASPFYGTGGSTGGGGSGGGATYQGANKWTPNISNAPWEGNTIKDQIYNCWSAVYGNAVATRLTCIAERESGYRPDAFNKTGYTSPDTGLHHWVYGLFQLSDIHSGFSWWPSGVAPGSASMSVAQASGGLLYNPEYNCRSAMSLYQAAINGGNADPWQSTSGSCA